MRRSRRPSFSLMGSKISAPWVLLIDMSVVLLAGCLSSTCLTSARPGEVSIGKYTLGIGNPRSQTGDATASKPELGYRQTHRRLAAAPPETPSGVYGVSSSSDPGSVWVSWTAPEDNNSTITIYEVMYTRTNATSVFENSINVTGNPAHSSLDIDGLITGAGYTFKVRAINGVGSGAQSEESDEVVLTPGRIFNATVSVHPNEAGQRSYIVLNFTCQHAVPADGHIYVELPGTFSAVDGHVVNSVVGNITNTLVSVDGLSITLSLVNSPADVPAGELISLTIMNITNPSYEGSTDAFVVRTMSSDGQTPIDEASDEFNNGDRPAGVSITPGQFDTAPVVWMANYVAGAEGSATISFTTSNPIPSDGHVVLEFPSNFISINCTSATATGIDGGFEVYVASDGYTVDIRRDGAGAEVDGGTYVSVALPDGISNQEFEGASDVFPLVKTTLADTAVSIDETSSGYFRDDRPAAVWFIPGAFSDRPTIGLESYVAGFEGPANVSFTTSNPLPSDGHVVVEFPRNFTSINCTIVTAAGIDGGFHVSVGANGFIVDIQRDGRGTEVEGGVNVFLSLLDGITNQYFEGVSDAFPQVKTTLADIGVSVDEASAEYNSDDRPQGAWFTPGRFEAFPSVWLETYVAGAEGSANITFTTANPVPADGRVIIEFPSNFTSINCSSVLAAGMDGGFSVIMGGDGYTVDIQRDGTGTEVGSGATVTLELVDGIVNQQFEGNSEKNIPMLKTTLSNTNISIDEASSDSNSVDRPAGVSFTPGAFATPPTVALSTYVSGVEGAANISFTTSNPIPSDGHVILEFPLNFTSITCTSATATGIDGGFEVSVASDGYTVDIQRDGTGAEVDGGAYVSVMLTDGIINQEFEGASDVFPLVKTTLADTAVSIDETSSDYFSVDRPAAVWFIPSAFSDRPTIELESYVAGFEGSANVSFTTSNPLPSDGHVVVEFPHNFTSINCTAAVAVGIDGEFYVSVGADGFTVDVQRDGKGTEIEGGVTVSLSLVDGITNQHFEGVSDVFSQVKTTLADSKVSVDEASAEFNSDDQPQGAWFTPGRFEAVPSVWLETYVAGAEGSANITFTTANPVPADGHIIIEFPSNFTSINCISALAAGMDGGFSVIMGGDGYTVYIQRDGTGTEVGSRATITLKLVDGIVNQQFGGKSDVFPMIRTTLAASHVSIDEASRDYNADYRPAGVEFTPGKFDVAPVVILESYIAGADGAANVSFTTSNPLPVDGHLVVQFPANFTSVSSNEVLSSSIDGGLSVSVDADGFTVDIERDGTGTEVASGVALSVKLLGGITNQEFEGASDVFPLAKTTLADTAVFIDETSAKYYRDDRPAAVWFIPGAFSDRPTIELESYVAGFEGSANVSFKTSNMLPSDGHVVVEFPRNFASINCTAAVAVAIDGGFYVSVGADGFTVDVQRDGNGTEVEGGVNVSLRFLDGIANQYFEGVSDAFPQVKTTLADVSVSVDEASVDFNSDDQPQGAWFTPGRFEAFPSVWLETYVAGAEGSANITFTTANPVPADGHVIIEFPSNFTSINCSSALAAGMDGGLSVTVGGDGYTVDIHRDGTGTEVGSGATVTMELVDGIVNQLFEGNSKAYFPVLKTTLSNTNISIDEASSDSNSFDRPSGVSFTPGAFATPPTVALSTYVSGVEGAANISFTISNPIPSDGHVILEFPLNFTSINCTSATVTGVDGGFEVSVASDGYTVDIRRDGTGAGVDGGTYVSVTLPGGITNQEFEGASDVFPLVKTTLADTAVSIDEASYDYFSVDRPAAVWFTPGAFSDRPTIELESYVAGFEGSANVSFTTSNPLPSDGHVVVEFPRNFTSIQSTAAVAVGIDGGFHVSVGADGFTVDVQRDGKGTEIEGGVTVSLSLVDGITNQYFEGVSDVFPQVKTTLADVSVSVDEASAEYNSDARPHGAWFTPGRFEAVPSVWLETYVAGAEGSANITFTTANPVPADGHVIIEFPSNFTSINCSSAFAAGMDGGLSLTVGGDGYVVDIHREGTGTEVGSGATVTLKLVDGIVNQQFEGRSETNFPVLKTTLSNTNISIDEASSDFNSFDRPAGVSVTPSAFATPPTVTLNTYISGAERGATVSFTTSNPIPSDGHVVLEFPLNFTSITCTSATVTGIDGGFEVSVASDGYTVDIRRDGTGAEVGGGTYVSVTLPGGITNQEFEGSSDVFPLVKTTLADTAVSIDETSSDYFRDDRPASVWFIPGAFSDRPTIGLESYVAGFEGSANVSFTTSNPLSSDGHVVVEFPRNFTSINCTIVTAVGIDGGFHVSVGADGFTVDIQRDGNGTEVDGGVTVSLCLVDGITNQYFEGVSDAFPQVKTTLADIGVSVDEASAEYNSDDRPQGAWFTPGRFEAFPSVWLETYVAGADGSANITFTTANPVPADGHAIIEFPSNFTSINCSSALAAGIDGGFSVIVGGDGYTVDIQRDGTGTELETGATVSLKLVDGIVNQQFEGRSETYFPLLKTTLSNTNISIDEASSDSNSVDRPAGVSFTPGAFATPPTAVLSTYVSGAEGAANISFTTSNPIPADGHVVLKFPSNFTSINCTSATATGIDGGFEVSVASDGYTVDIRRDGTGAEVDCGTYVSVTLTDGIINQEFEGASDVFPLVKTTLADTAVSIDETSSDYFRKDRPVAVWFLPGAFSDRPTIGLESYVAGFEGSANVSFTTSNPFPSDGHVVVEFPHNFTSINCTAAVAVGIDGGFYVSVGADGFTVDVQRDGNGTEMEGGVNVSLSLVGGITNQYFEGGSDVFPQVKTTLADIGVSVDETSADYNSDGRPQGAWFTPGRFEAVPSVWLETYVAGAEGSANITFTTANPVPADGHVIIDFPSNFTSINCSSALAAGMDGGFSVIVGGDGYTVDIQRDGTGTEVGGGAIITLELVDGIVNQLFEGWTHVFPMIRTTLAASHVSIDEASSEYYSDDRPAGVAFTPGRFKVSPVVSVESYIAGADGAANVSFTTSNPLPINGHVVVHFPGNFTFLSSNEVLSSSIDGGLSVSVDADGYTVDIERDGTGTEVASGVALSVKLVGGITNQEFEGASDVFPLVKTTLADTAVSIDETSSDYFRDDRPAAVWFIPGTFPERPTIGLESYVAGFEGAADVSFTTLNPVPSDGHVVVQFPHNFTSIKCTAAVAVGIDGGLYVSVGADGFTVDIQRDGNGTEVEGGVNVFLSLVDGITNQLFEGASDVFPQVKTTLADVSVSVDEASADFNSDDRPLGAWFTPGRFEAVPSVWLETYVAGAEGSANITFKTASPVPADGHVIIEFPSNFTSINCSSVLAAGMDGGFSVTVGGDGYTVDIQRDGTGTEAGSGTTVSLKLVDGIVNQQFEGRSDVFPMIRTTLAASHVSIDEASSDYYSDDRPAGVWFTPGRFDVSPVMWLESYVAGATGSANISFAIQNPLPNDGNIIVEFPSAFSSVDITATSVSGIDGGVRVWVASDGYMVYIERDGTGSEVEARQNISVALLHGITNQFFEGKSSIFPMVKTTLGKVDISIDEASSDYHSADRPSGVRFTPGAFGTSPTVALSNYAAGFEGAANVSFTTANSVPADGHVIVTFPRNFTSITCSAATAFGMDGGFTVSVESDGYTVDLQRDGTGSTVKGGASISVTVLDGVMNQQHEGASDIFPLVKTTLADANVSIDETSPEVNREDRAEAVRFTPAAFTEAPMIWLDSYVAGIEGAANISFTTTNPIPVDGHVIAEFPKNFTSINPTTAVGLLGLDGGFLLSVGLDGYTVDVERDGTGTDVEAGAVITIRLADGIVNQQFEALSTSFPSVKTTLADKGISIDDSKEGPDLPAICFTAATLLLAEATLQYDVAGMYTSTYFSFTTANPLPSLGVIYVEFPADFSSATPILAESAELGPLSVNGSYMLTVWRDGSGDWLGAGSAITLMLSKVVNRDVIGATGNFSITTFTDASMSHRIDTGIAPSVMVGKQIVSATAAFGSSGVAVVAQEKRWIFSGYEVALGDQVKWVNSSASSDGHCNWQDDEIDVDSSTNGTSATAKITFAESSDGIGPLQLCYRFSNGDHPFKLYPTITVSVYELYGVFSAEQGSTVLSVVGYPKVLTLSGFGTAELDEARWLLQGGANCTFGSAIAGLSSGGDDGENTAILLSSMEAAFEFTDNVFNDGNSSANVTLCYKFGSEKFQHYPAMSMGIHHVTGWTSEVGEASVAVVGVPEDLTFTGYGISENEFSSDRSRWILSGTNCSENTAGISEAGDDRVDVSSGQATFTFSTSTSGETPRLCYWFQDEPAMIYSSHSINIAYLSVLSAPSFGDDDVAVVGYPKIWGFAGGHIEDGDYVRWIYNESSDCSDASSVAEMYEDGEISSGETECTFATSLSGRWITPCYRHSNEPWRRYDIPVYVKMVHTMTAAWGNNSACVVDQPKQWVFGGDGLATTGGADLIKFVVGATDCTRGSDAILTDADFDGVSMYLTSESSATFIVESAAAGEVLHLCYKFGNEEFMWYEIRAYVNMLKSVESHVGGKDIAVVGVQEIFDIQANGTSSQDYIRWIVADDTSSDGACNGTISVWDISAAEAKEMTDVAVFAENGAFLTNFTFGSSSAGLSPTLCYKFAEELWKVYADVTIDVAMLLEVHANEGSDGVAVVDYSKMWRFYGLFLASGDQIFWSESSCETYTAATLVEDSDGILVVDDTLAPWFTFDSPASGKTLQVCYQFNDEPFKRYEEFEIDVRMIRAVAVDIGSARKAIPNVAKVFSFIGDGTALEASIDRVKWIDGEDCRADGIIGDIGGLAERKEFDLVYFESTGFTAQTVKFPEVEVGGPYAMCYAFDEEPYKAYDDLVLTVLGISEVTPEEGADDTIVIGALKRLNFTGGGAVEAGDHAVWVSGAKVDSDCLVDVFLDGPEGIVDSLFGADFFIPDEDGEAMAGRTWTLCYRFGTESFKIYPDFSLSSVTLDTLTAEAGSDDDSVVGYPKTFNPAGTGIAEGDMAKWVGAAVTTDAGCEFNGVVEESMVALKPTYSTGTGDSTIATAGEEFVLASSFTFTYPTLSSARVQLCYRHQTEPYHLHPSITLRTRQLISASVRELGAEQTLRAITNSPQAVAFVAHGGMEGDRYKWVQTTAGDERSASSTGTSENFFEICAEWVEPAAGSSIGVAAGFYQEASFTFLEPASNLILCFAPGSEPFMPYTAVSMEVLYPVVSGASPTHVLVGRPASIRLIGTFGLTSGDAMKLADNADGDCSGDPAGGETTIFYPDATAEGLTGPTFGTSDITLYVSERTEEDRPFKLCYRFGATGLWELFDTVSWEAYEVTAVSVDIGDGSPVAGELMDFTFAGTGVLDGDHAKWADVSTSSDSQCESALTALGSPTAEIVGGVGEFSFDGDVEDWVLCYKHGSDAWRLYGTITPVSISTATSPETVASETLRTKADVSMTLEGNIGSYPEGSTARSDFLWAFLSDLGRALGVKTSRFAVTSLRAGSVVVEFAITSTGSLADSSVTELLGDLEEQMADESSSLRSGNVTSAAKGFTYSTAIVDDSNSTESSSGVIGLSVVGYQAKGLFGFAEVALYTTEASETITLTIQRNHGTKGVMDIGYATSDGTAIGGNDYVISQGTVRFYSGDTSKTFEIPLMDDADTEPHFEFFTVSLSLQGPINEAATLMLSAAEATIFLYDYGDGVALAGTTFAAAAKDSASSAKGDLSFGWAVTDNGGEEGWVDSNGFAAKDAVFGADEYDDRCDFAATVPCDHDCVFGGGLAELFPATGESPAVLRLNDSGYVATAAPVTDFPSTALSVSLWVRVMSSTQGEDGGTLVSYAAPDANPGESELLLHNINRLSLLVHGKFVAAADRYDGPNGGNLDGIRTGINLARDNAWHHVAVAWRSSDGSVEAFLDGARVFDGGPYKTGAELATGGRLVLGQAQFGNCDSAEISSSSNTSASDPMACEVLSGEEGPGGLGAEVQHLRLWSKFLTADEVAQQMQAVFQGNSVGQVLHWDFTPALMEDRTVEDASGIGVSVSGVPNHGLLSEHGSDLVQASPSLNPGYPCGAVHSGIWRFAAPEDFVAALRGNTSYGGRLQFRLAYTTANGDIRSTRGALTIRSTYGQEISWNLIFRVAEATPGEWTHVSVVLREDHGWLSEPLGGALTAPEMKAIMADAGEVLIRGDIRVFGQGGGGQEVVYLQDVRLLAKA